ncbi:MAG: preprotein translocase subunit SecG [Beijerinckiaceae bacterium]|nr:preprotein translocase subunit SecG [Beijerinckiaceae bacterium]
MESILIVIHLLIVSALAVVVLLQRSEGGGLGLGGGGGPTGLFTGRGQANLLTRTTAILGAAFFVTSLALSILAARSNNTGSPLDLIPTTTTPSTPGAPAGQGQGVLDQLRGAQQPAPAVPAAPQPEAPK